MLVDIVKVMNWIYILIVYSDDFYGMFGYYVVKEEVKKVGMKVLVYEECL